MVRPHVCDRLPGRLFPDQTPGKKKAHGPLHPPCGPGFLIFYLVVGLVTGARLGYIFFYQYMNLPDYIHHPLEIIAVWDGGMSFHGGLIGIVIAGWWFSKRTKLPFWALADRVVIAAPIGLGLGRVGNFINGELYGRITNVPWGIVFPDGGPLPRHPSQLYEAFLEGLILFLILLWLSKRRMPDGFLLGTFLLGYGLFRFLIEFFREPDPQLGFVLGPFTMGQALCVIMAGLGILVLQCSFQHRFQNRRMTNGSTVGLDNSEWEKEVIMKRLVSKNDKRPRCV